MKVMLTSFGIGCQSESDHRPSFARLFDNMPPIYMNWRGRKSIFIPDYAVLLLCSKVILDKITFRKLNDRTPGPYSFIAETLTSLYEEGFVQLADYHTILQKNNSILESMLSEDLKTPETWFSVMEKSNRIWQNFLKRRFGNNPPFLAYWGMFHEFGHAPLDTDHLVTRRVSRTAQAELQRGILHGNLRRYLQYVNSNIIISHELDAGFHDWMDFQPFYEQKFLGLRQNHFEQRKFRELRKLFQVQFPELEISDSSSLVAILKDKRIEKLRELVDEAVQGNVKFDKNFAADTRKAIENIPKRAKRYCKIASWLTMPLLLLPYGGFVKKGIEEAAERVTDYELRKPYQWFYLLSEC